MPNDTTLGGGGCVEGYSFSSSGLSLVLVFGVGVISCRLLVGHTRSPFTACPLSANEHYFGKNSPQPRTGMEYAICYAASRNNELISNITYWNHHWMPSHI